MNSPHQTTSCRFIKLDTIAKGIESYALSHENYQLVPINNLFGLPCYILTAGTSCSVKPFTIPVKFNLRGQECYCIDARQVTAVSGYGSYRITSFPDWNLLSLLCLLTSIWDSSDRTLVENIAIDLSAIYGTWVSSTISAYGNLQPDQRGEVTILGAYFYLSQITEEAKNIDKISGRIAKDLKLDFDRVYDVVSTAGSPILNLDDFVEAIKATSAGIRLDKLETPVIYQVSTAVWTGTLGRGIMEVALEFPPYIVALVHQAINEKSYRRCRFFEYVEIFNRRREIEAINHPIEYLSRRN